MKRRQVLQSLGGSAVVLLSGCFTRQQTTNNPNAFEGSIEVTEGNCEEQPKHNVGIEFLPERNEIVAEGAVVGHGPCESVRLSVLTDDTGERSDEVWVRIIPDDDLDQCEPCPARLQYVATVTFSTNYFPSSVDILHKQSPDGGIVYGETFERQNDTN